MRRKRSYPMGSISSGTMQPCDLIPAFVWELKGLAEKAKRRDHLLLCAEVSESMNDNAYYLRDESEYDLDALFNALDEYAGPYFYFGAHPGDGADYGFWLIDDFPGCCFDGLRVTDLSEVPKGYAGEILLTNDHGNMSLYVKARTQEPREIWAIV